MRRIVRYKNRKLYEAKARRFVTLNELAQSVASGSPVAVVDADTGEDLTAQTLSRALAGGKAPVPATTDALSRLLQAGRHAAETAAKRVAGVVERVGGTEVAARVRKAAKPDNLTKTLRPLTERVGSARHDVERIVADMVGRGRLSWDEGTRLKDDLGAVIRTGLADVLGRVRELASHMASTSPELAHEVADIKRRLDQLEALAPEPYAAPQGATPRNRARGPKTGPTRKTTPAPRRRSQRP